MQMNRSSSKLHPILHVPLKSLAKRFVVGVIVLNLVVAGIIWFSLHQSKIQYLEHAEVVSKNITQVLEKNLIAIADKADIALQAVSDEAERQLATGAIQKQSLNNYIIREHSRLPELIALRATDASGDAIYGPTATPVKTTSLAHRDYFKFLQNTPHTGLVISKPLIGGISGKWMIVLARRINQPDGSFAGLVYAGISLDRLTKTFSEINVGTRGSLSLLDSDFALVARYPEYKPENSYIGKKITSQQLFEKIQAGKTDGTYVTKSSTDGIERIYSFRKLSFSNPLYLFVGLSTSDLLSNWRTEILKMSLFMLFFLTITTILTWLFYKALCRSKKAEQSILISEERFRHILQDVESIAVQGYGPDGTTQYWNHASEKLYGYSSEEAIGRNLLDLIIPPDMHSDTVQAIKYMAETGQPIPASELSLMRKDGSRVPVFSSHTIVQIPGQDQELFCLDIDLTEIRLAEEALKESEERFKALHDATFNGIIIHDKGLILECNQGLSDMTGFTNEELVGMNGLKLIAPDWLDLVVKNIQHGYEKSYEVEGLRKDGSRYPLAIKGKNASYKGHNAQVIEFRDITDLKKAEQEKLSLELQLQQSQKLESLGVLAGGIAHDFNNLLSIIIGHCSLVKLKPTKALDCILPIETAAAHAAALCQQMLAYAGKAHFSKSLILLEELVNEMVELSKSSIGRNVEITSELASDIPPMIADASQIRQITMNLIINASEAIDKSQGVVHVSLAKRAVRADHQEIDYFGKIIPPGMYACLEVTDNGCGMDDETKQRIFEPFYTTKFTGRGLGMSAVLGIVKAHNGALQLFSQPGQGTTFNVFLPIQMTVLTEVPSSQQTAPPVPWQGSGTILLAEDEELIRCVAVEMLEELGFKVITASNGKEAMELYRQHASEICLTITDIGMPVMDGYALFRELKSINPELPIIISSGFGDKDISAHIAPENIAGLISKPYSFDKLREVLKSVVEAEPKE
jgi:PAS domain S-box-containing protein